MPAHNLVYQGFPSERWSNRKPSVIRIIGDEKWLNMGFFCLKNKHLLAAAAALLQHPTRTEGVQAAVPTCSTEAAAEAASTNRQTRDLTCAPRYSLCKQGRHNENIGPPWLSCLPVKGSEWRRSRERGGKGARACSSGGNRRDQ